MDKKQKIKAFKALGHETRFDIFENVFSGGYACCVDKAKPDEDMFGQATCVTTIAQNFDSKLPTLLFIGGSQGSQIMNDTLIESLPELLKKYLQAPTKI